MIIETIRAVADALTTGSYGVNYQIQNLSVESGDVQPPQIVEIVDETRSDEVAVGRYPKNYPCLVVTLDGNPTLQGDVVSGVRDGEVSVVIRYITKDADSAKSVVDTYNTLRAVMRTLKEFNSNIRSADRMRNDVQIIECLNVEVTQTFQQLEDSFNTGAVKATFRVRDIQP